MTHLLRQLDSDDSVLLLYLADELPPEDRQAVQHRLSADPGLRAQLDRLKVSMENANAALARLDALSPPAAPDLAAQRIIKAMRRRQVEQLARPATVEEARGLRFPWWSYPLTAAAAVLLAFLVWWGNSGPGPTAPNLAGGPPPTVIESGDAALESVFGKSVAESINKQQSLDQLDQELLALDDMGLWQR